MVVIVELDVAQQQATLPLEVDLLRAVDHDLGDARVSKQRLNGTETNDVGGQLLEQALLFGPSEHQVFGFDDLVEQALQAQANLVDLVAVNRRVELRDQLAFDAVLETALGLAGLSLDGIVAKGWLGLSDLACLSLWG